MTSPPRFNEYNLMELASRIVPEQFMHRAEPGHFLYRHERGLARETVVFHALERRPIELVHFGGGIGKDGERSEHGLEEGVEEVL